MSKYDKELQSGTDDYEEAIEPLEEELEDDDEDEEERRRDPLRRPDLRGQAWQSA